MGNNIGRGRLTPRAAVAHWRRGQGDHGHGPLHAHAASLEDDGEAVRVEAAGCLVGCACCRYVLGRVDSAWKMYPVGFLFGLGFDTASEVGLLALAALSEVPPVLVMLLPALFAAGMALVDTCDGLLVLLALARGDGADAGALLLGCGLTAASASASLGIGRIAASSRQIWDSMPEKMLGTTEAWAQRNPKTLIALVKAITEAGAWLDEPANRPEAARILASPRFLNVPAEVIARSLSLPDFHIFHRQLANFPWRSHADWFLSQMVRWGQVAPRTDMRAVADRVIFMDRGEIVEQNEPEAFFANPRNERTKLFLGQILHNH